jgi:hypothetical protein
VSKEKEADKNTFGWHGKEAKAYLTLRNGDESELGCYPTGDQSQ